MATFNEQGEVAESSNNSSFVVPRLTTHHPHHQQQQQPSADAGAAQTAAAVANEDDDIYDDVDVNTSTHIDISINEASALSPTDGYFQPRSSTADVWTSDPSLAQGDPADTKAKIEEADGTGLRDNAPPQHHSQLRNSSFHPNSPYYQPSHNTGAPPDYRRYPPIRRLGDRSAPASGLVILGPNRSESIFSDQSSQIPLEAPPAYTPSTSSSGSSNNGSPRRARNSRYTVITAPSSSRSRSLGAATRSYNTFPSESNIMGLSHHEEDEGLEAEESRGLLAGRRDGPESMADAVPDEEEALIISEDGELRLRRRESWGKRVPWLHGRNCRIVGLVVVLLVLAVGFLVSWASASNNKEEVPLPGKAPPKEGATLPGQDPDNGDDNVMDPAPSYPPFDGPLGFSDNRCRSSITDLPTQKFSVDLSKGRRLAITQNISESQENGPDIRIAGDVVFRRAYSGTESSSVVVELTTNGAQVTPEITLSPDQHLVVTVPRAGPPVDGSAVPCLGIRVTAWVPPSSTIDSLAVNSIHLGIRLLSDLSLSVPGATRLNTAIGAIVGATTGGDSNADMIRSGSLPASYAFSGREIVVHTLSSPIQGSWPLYDLLDLKSTSGAIQVGVTPKPAAEEDPRPARLAVKSFSGTVEVFEPVRSAMQSWAAALMPATSPNDALTAAQAQTMALTESLLPPRDYSATVETTSASIHVELAFSSLARVSSFSGRITASMLPVLPARLAAPQLSAQGGGWRAQLQTHTTSGSTVVGCLDPMWYDDDSEKVAGIRDARYVSTVMLPVPNETTAGVGGGNYLHVMSSKHESTSGSIKAVYPASWEGDIQLNSVSGSLLCTGDGVRIGRDNVAESVVGLKAKKGSQGPWEASGITGRTTSGSIRVEFPE